MEVWLVELFGGEGLNRLFWIISLSTAPFWLLMLLFGKYDRVKALCHPWIVPPLLGGLYIYCIFLVFTVTAAPDLPEVTMKSMRNFWTHPFLFIALWAHRMIIDLFCGMIINRTRDGQGRAGKISLLLVWLFGPLGLMVFAIRFWAGFRDRRSG